MFRALVQARVDMTDASGTGLRPRRLQMDNKEAPRTRWHLTHSGGRGTRPGPGGFDQESGAAQSLRAVRQGKTCQ